MGYAIQQSTAAQPLVFLMTDSTGAPKTGLTCTVTISKNGGSPAAPAGAVTEVGGGLYKVAANATDSGTLGPLVLHASATGAADTWECYPIVAYDPIGVLDAIPISGNVLFVDSSMSGGLQTGKSWSTAMASLPGDMNETYDELHLRGIHTVTSQVAIARIIGHGGTTKIQGNEELPVVPLHTVQYGEYENVYLFGGDGLAAVEFGDLICEFRNCIIYKGPNCLTAASSTATTLGVVLRNCVITGSIDMTAGGTAWLIDCVQTDGTNAGDVRVASSGQWSKAGDAMTLTSAERTTLSASLWNTLTAAMTTAGSIGKKLADWVIGSPLQSTDVRLPSTGTIATNTDVGSPAQATDIPSASTIATAVLGAAALTPITANATQIGGGTATAADGSVTFPQYVPDAGGITDSVLDAASASHVVAGSIGERISGLPEHAAGAIGGLPVLDANLRIDANATVELTAEQLGDLADAIADQLPAGITAQQVRDAMALALGVGVVVAANSVDDRLVDLATAVEGVPTNTFALIGSANVTVESPLTSDLEMLITRYDDYLDADGRAFTWTNSAGTWCGGDISTWTVTWTAATTDGVTVLSKALTKTASTGTQVVKLDLTSTNTSLFTASGRVYKYQILFSKTGHRSTLLSGDITVTENLGSVT